MPADDAVTATLAEWEALVEADFEEDLRADLSPIATALLGFAREVLDIIQRECCPGGPCEHSDSVWAADGQRRLEEVEQAARKWIGGEG